MGKRDLILELKSTMFGGRVLRSRTTEGLDPDLKRSIAGLPRHRVVVMGHGYGSEGPREPQPAR